MTTCYMCESVGTTKEHAPPKCIFPEVGDLPDGSDLRVNLIKVPACEVHNTQKSKDDEYLLNVLSMNVNSNKAGIRQFLTKVNRAAKKNPSLRQRLLKTARRILLKDTLSGNYENTIAITIEKNRIESSLECCARALYYYDFKEKFQGNVQIIPLFLKDLNPSYDKTLDRMEKGTAELFKDIPLKGDNPPVFTYRFHNDIDSVMLEMNFYEGSKALAFMKKNAETLSPTTETIASPETEK